jgi:hypothetical protein
MIRLLLSLIALCFALPAAAHETTRSYLTLQSDGPAVTADLRLAYRDIEVAVWMDENLDGQITWGEAKARLGAVTSYVLANVSLSDREGPCKLTLQDQSSLTDAGVDYLSWALWALVRARAA